MELKNELGWSQSRINLLEECPRKYYYNYYGSWGGWDPSSEDKAKEIYMLKKLGSLPILLGQTIHETIQFILDSLSKGRTVSAGQAEQHFKSAFTDAVLKSKKGFYKKIKCPGLVRHEYGIEIPESEVQDAIAQGTKCLCTFLSSDVFKEIKTIPIEDWIPCQGYNAFYYDGIKVWAIYDFAYIKNKKVKIIELKSGKNRFSERTPQVDGYGFYFIHEKKIEPKNIVFLKFHLYSDKIDEFYFDEESVSNIQKRIKEDYSKMEDLLSNKKENIADVKEFPKTDNSVICRNCNFRRVCEKEEGDKNGRQN